MEDITSRERIKAILDDDKRAKVIQALSGFVLGSDMFEKFMETFEDQIRLANSTNEEDRKKSDLFWENTFVRRLLDGKENGTYIGIDLGGTNLRLVRLDMKNGEATTETKYYELKEETLTRESVVVFDYITTCLKSFLSEGNFDGSKPLPIGFTFSFPSFQKSLRESIIQTWTKRFRCTDGPGLDAVQLLEEAIQRNGPLPVPVEVVARISDTTGTLLAGNLVDKNCRIGLIVGTGSNAAFVEYTRNIAKWDKHKDADPNSEVVVINCEFGNFGDNGCIDFLKMPLDFEVDKHSPHPGSYTFEKLFSGLYLGEVCRLAFLKLVEAGVLFQGCNCDQIKTRWGFSTSKVAEIERDTTNSDNTKNVLKEFGLLEQCIDEDIMIVREVCAIMSQRGAYIIATAMVVLLNHINLPEVTIAVDGSLYEHHPTYPKHMAHIIDTKRPATKTKTILVKDGSGQGGALVAAIAEKRSG